MLALASATALGIAHSHQGLTGMLTTGLNGLLFGVVYIYAGRHLLPAMICHAAGNVYGITLLYLGA